MCGGAWSLLGVLAAALVAMLLERIYTAGELKSLSDIGMEGCRLLGVEEGVAGSEDLHFRPDGIAFLSVDNKSYWHTDVLKPLSARVANAKGPGKFFTYDTKTDQVRQLRPGPSFPKDFHPHGFSMMPRVGLSDEMQVDLGGGDTLLYVVSHTASGDKVEILLAKADGEIHHVRTISSDLFKTINDVAATPTGFYVTNWMTYLPYENLLSVPELVGIGPTVGLSSYVIYCELGGDVFANKTEACTVVASDWLSMANGIEISPDGKRVYLIESTGKRFNVYDVPLSGHGHLLIPRQKLPTHSACDNLALGSDGALFSGCHPKAMTFNFLHHRSPHKFRSPSEVIKFDADGKTAKSILLSAAGQPLSGSSSATVHDGVLLVGGVDDKGFLVCPETFTRTSEQLKKG